MSSNQHAVMGLSAKQLNLLIYYLKMPKIWNKEITHFLFRMSAAICFISFEMVSTHASGTSCPWFDSQVVEVAEFNQLR